MHENIRFPESLALLPPLQGYLARIVPDVTKFL